MARDAVDENDLLSDERRCEEEKRRRDGEKTWHGDLRVPGSATIIRGMTAYGFPRRAATVALFSIALGCASAPTLPADATTVEVLAAYGGYTTETGATPEEIVVIRDRHYIGGGITFVDDELRALQREHGRLVAALVDRGYRLLGAEWRKGPLPDDDAARAHRQAARDVMEEGDDLNRRSIYQPIRYEVEHAGRLTVLGVEDASLYDQDVKALETLTALSQARRRHDTTTGPSESELDLRWAKLRRAMKARIDPRGRASARNLLEAMRERKERKAILLVGAAHVPGAAAELKDLGVTFHVFTAPSFERKSERTGLR